MADHQNIQLPASETRTLSEHAGRIAMGAFGVGIVALLVAGAMAVSGLSERGGERFAFSYLTSFAFFLSLSLGSMCFVLVTHLFRAGWCVVVRRPAEVLAANIPILALLSIPILLFVLANNGTLYPWAQNFDAGDAYHAAANEVSHEATVLFVADIPAIGDNAAPAGQPAAESGDHDAHGNLAYMVNKKRAWLNPSFFTLRWLIYLAIWSGIGLWYWRTSTRQDSKADDSLTLKREVRAAPLTLLFGLTITFAAFDLLMSLDPTWYSTIFGVYYFAGSFMGAIAVLILVLMGLQRRGYLQNVVTTEHYHDLGKLLFAFVFFWGYIAFSQFMLLWYASLPETVTWFDTRRVTTVSEQMDLFGWTGVALLLLFGHLLIPFLGLLSRHAKRNHKVLAFWAVWLLVMHWIDLYWLVMPVFDNTRVMPGLIELGCLVGIGGIFVGGAIRLLARHSLLAVNDPRLNESLSFHNF